MNAVTTAQLDGKTVIISHAGQDGGMGPCTGTLI
jgi:hypothetical protein